ncbi:MAG: outer membrane lipoprotein carrier protein LolA [Terriglobia bacterium]
MSISHCRRNLIRRGLAAFLVAWVASRAVPARSAFSPPAADVSTSVDEFVSRLESAYRETRTLRAEFTQKYTSSGRTRTESGVVYFARGGKMRWDYREPAEKVFLCDGKQLLLYVPSEKQLTRSRVKSSEDARVPFRLLLSRLNLHKVFGRIEFGDQALKPEPGDRVLVGLPKHKEEDEFREVLMELTPAFDLRRLVIRSPDQSTMEFTFDHIERNVPLKPAIFTFTPPPGTEVIDQGENGE